MELTDFEMEEEEHTSFFYIYVVYTESETYRKEVRRLIGQYSRYIRLKLMEDDGELAKALTGYPAEKDLVEACSLEEQKRRWFSELPWMGYFRSFHRWPWSWTGRNSTGSISPWRSGNFPPGTGLPMAWENIRWPEEPLTASTSEIPSVICSFRKKASSFALLEKASREGLSVTLSFSYIRDFLLESTEELLDELSAWCGQKERWLELLVNDWGLAELLRKRGAPIWSRFSALFK